ncbi:Response regulator [Ignavibacterium album JCM 16511]|uniref:Response regulator n=1 Tax=Ignavibacterium album (strain DSM 19864 / JCM 16511 / NBRC 101810 / Mat9-16) TaxID=945713 RepID=I0AHY5_IGNAJ|nr:Response regulator [Ignavibacterium album JCM 16511]
MTVVEDEPEILEGIEIILNQSLLFQCTGTYSNGEKLLEEINILKPDLVLMDIVLPGINGIECLKLIKMLNPDILVVMLTVFEDDEKIFNSILAGADGYLLKKTPPNKLIESLSDIVNGGVAMNPQIAKKVLDIFRIKPAQEFESLSNREMEILDGLVKGFTHKQIAEKLFISPETVRGHLKNIYRKLHVHSKTEAVVKALSFNPYRKY